MLTSRQVTAEDAVRYDPASPDAALAVAGDRLHAFGEVLYVIAVNGKTLAVERGQWVVRYAPGDVGVMDDGEYRRYFGEPEG